MAMSCTLVRAQMAPQPLATGFQKRRSMTRRHHQVFCMFIALVPRCSAF